MEDQAYQEGQMASGDALTLEDTLIQRLELNDGEPTVPGGIIPIPRPAGIPLPGPMGSYRCTLSMQVQ